METVCHSCCAQEGPRNETQTHSNPNPHRGTRIKRNKVAFQHPADIFRGRLALREAKLGAPIVALVLEKRNLHLHLKKSI